MPEAKLETPTSVDELYLAREVDLHELRFRPAFTGDVYQRGAGFIALVQHPCAMRRGAELTESLLAANVVPNRSGVPADWASGSFKRMFLPGLSAEPLAVALDELVLVAREEIKSEQRVAILSNLGVNILVQRWLFHNSRVVVPTITINAQSVGPFEEADLLSEASLDLVAGGMGSLDALALVDDWLGKPHASGGISRRHMLSNAQHRSAVRSALRRQVKEWAAAVPTS